MAGEKKTSTLTARETELAILGWRGLKSPPEVDYAKMVELGGFKNVASARACFAPIMKKLMEGGATPGAAPAPKKAVKRPAPQQKDDGGEDGSRTNSSDNPFKKARARRRKTMSPHRQHRPVTPVPAAADEDEDESDDGI